MMARLTSVLVAFLAAAASTSIVHVSAQNITGPTAVLNVTGTVVGVSNPFYGVDEFLGIPFAQPPVGNLRFAAPVPLVANASRVIQATAYGPSCLQPPSTAIPITAMSEDCLTVNVFRPAGLNATAKLPVMVWIYGGSFINGGSVEYNPALIIGASVAMNEPVVYVSLNYRVNSFGFLAGTELATAAKAGKAALNAGLYDQRAALLWVQQNIDAFGGDHTKVTVFGESAGAISIGSHLVADKGTAVKKLNLFRGAIMESGAPSGDGVPPPAYLEPAYQAFAKLLGCSAGIADGTSLQCLRALPTAAVYNATLGLLSVSAEALPFNRVQDGYFHDSAPSVQVRAKKVANVPILTGNNLDEGTLFGSTTVNSSAGVISWLKANLYDATATAIYTSKLLPELLKLYPDDPALGSPFNPLNVSKTDRFYGPTNQYKRLAAMVGDGIFQSGRRLLLEQFISRDKYYPVYNYLFTAPTPGASPALGIYHSSEIAFVYGSYAYANPTNSTGRTSAFMTQSWIAFANTLHPNRPYLPTWPKYGTTKQTLQLGPVDSSANASVTKVITDNYREAGLAFLGTEAWTSQVDV